MTIFLFVVYYHQLSTIFRFYSFDSFSKCCPQRKQRKSFPFVGFVFIKGSQIKRIKQIFLPYSFDSFSKNCLQRAEFYVYRQLFVNYLLMSNWCQLMTIFLFAVNYFLMSNWCQLMIVIFVCRQLSFDVKLMSIDDHFFVCQQFSTIINNFSLPFVQFVFYKFVRREIRFHSSDSFL